MVELYIVRHGETDTNYENRINGMSTDMPLNANGIKQIEELKKHLDINKFDEVYSSPLKRAMQTAEILNQGVHEVQQDKRLYEADYGSWDGIREEDLVDKYPDAFDENNYLLPSYTKYAKNGEEYADVYKRVEDFMDDMGKKGDEKIMVVCHGFVSRSFLKVVTGADDISRIIQPDNGGVSKYTISKSGTKYINYYGRVNNID
ncbi:histidine phosphatase family protein [Companilactobacillus halodurans]|uniref:Histidine phosphatase family protein n=1 Tax=Companilactobacillus halodurans TaxID=2584183 RepID=A0A5P0ZZ20_9LACO|nr:histidine phosphatase family protein [Companilactobacillus halodurans]MQS76655.1 histidine phosphatase family protein [Companilactobacillus halodurans]MQS98299.1 histidine phosphatase family protein [Companilactobacillus halodurans]